MFDSDIDNWSMNSSVFDDKIRGKKQLLFHIEDTYGERFGYYLNTQIMNRCNYFFTTQTDDKSFEFNLHSNGRMNSMTKFNIKNTSSGYFLSPKSNKTLIYLGDIVLYKQNYKSLSYCQQSENYYDYQGITNALCGRPYSNFFFSFIRVCFTPMKITVIQMI